MKEENFDQEMLDMVNELIEHAQKSLKSSDAVATRLYDLDEFREKLEKLMFEEFHARFKAIKEFYDLKAYGISIAEVIELSKRLDYYFDEMKKIETEILSLIDDETGES